MLTLLLAGGGGLVIGFAVKHFLTVRTAPATPWDKEQWDELQETIMIAAALILYGGFEYMCFLNQAYATAPHTNATRLVLTNIVNSLFTFKFTKNQIRNGANH